MEGWFVGNQELCRFVVKTENCPKAKGADEAQIVGLQVTKNSFNQVEKLLHNPITRGQNHYTKGWFVGNQKLCRFVTKTENCPKAKGADKAQMIGLQVTKNSFN